MSMRAASILTTLLMVFMFGAANAQGAAPPQSPQSADTQRYYRCGPQGQDLRDSPCPDGAGRAVDVPRDAVDPKDAAAASRRTASESRTLAARQRERERQAAKTPPAAAAGIDGRLAAQKAPRQAERPSKPADPKKPKPKDPKPAPKKKPKLPKSPEPALPPTPST